MISVIDNILNRVTMYRLVLYYLLVLIGVAFIFGFFGLVPYDPTAIAFSVVLITAVCWCTNWIFARTFDAATNVESVYITSLILALIISPVVATDRVGVGFLIFASVWAMASKYLFAIGKKHIFNPAALAVALSVIAINQPATWWVGTTSLMPFVLVGGLLIVRKIRRFDMVGSFSLVALATVVLESAGGVGGFMELMTQTIMHSSFLFFAFVMLTEPLTSPPNRWLRICYGVVVGFLFATTFHIGSFYMTPEVALLVGNVFSFVVSPKGRYTLTLSALEQAGKDVYDFVFTPDRAFAFLPGQYVELTLPHPYPDNRGNRRYFTLASAPTEAHVRFGIKFYAPSSTFKRALALMKVGSTLSISQLAGAFTLPRDAKKKLVFIAGGIGVTPFRSMIQYLLDVKESRSIVMLYSNRTLADVAYRDIFDRAQVELGIKTLYVLSDEKNLVPGMIGGFIDAKMIAQQIPDYKERTFYISGPHGMVVAFKKTLTEMGVSRFNIHSDFFPGFV